MPGWKGFEVAFRKALREVAGGKETCLEMLTGVAYQPQGASQGLLMILCGNNWTEKKITEIKEMGIFVRHTVIEEYFF